jgi:hypothetical protein
VALLLMLALGVVACDDDNPAAPSDPNSFTLTAALTPGNEVPPVTNADASGSGTVTVTLAVTRDAANAITGGTANFTVNLTGFPANTTLTGAHIHQAAAGANGSIVVNTGLANGEVTLANGSGSFTKNGIAVNATIANGLVTGVSGFYFNVHTTLSPGGAVRGQLTIQP